MAQAWLFILSTYLYVAAFLSIGDPECSKNFKTIQQLTVLECHKIPYQKLIEHISQLKTILKIKKHF